MITQFGQQRDATIDAFVSTISEGESLLQQLKYDSLFMTLSSLFLVVTFTREFMYSQWFLCDLLVCRISDEN